MRAHPPLAGVSCGYDEDVEANVLAMIRDHLSVGGSFDTVGDQSKLLKYSESKKQVL